MKRIVEEDYSRCLKFNCPLYNSKAPMESVYCQNQCPHVKVRREEVVYVNERNKYGIPKEIAEMRFSKSMIKQLTYYHFCCDQNGICANISISQMAEYMGICKNQAVLNFRKLADLGYIAFTKLTSDLYSLVIVGYKDYFKRKEGSGRGFITLAVEEFELMAKGSNVNVVRFFIMSKIYFHLRFYSFCFFD